MSTMGRDGKEGRTRMLIRQRCLLYMVERADRPVSHLELTKWAFLVAREMPTGGGSSFYDFVPYHYGPFSFTLFREVAGLVRDGYLREDDDKETWQRVEDVNGSTGDLSAPVQSDAARVVDRFRSKTVDDLVDYVYGEFPWYTVNSRKRKLAEKPTGDLAVHTVGYEKWSVDRLLDELMRKGISRIIDVRSNPIARRYGFHKSTLRRLADKLDIGYVHIPELGIPSNKRKELVSPTDYHQLLDHYTRVVIPSQEDAVRRIVGLVQKESSVLLCMESDPVLCHRTRLAKVVSGVTGLPVLDVRGNQCALISN